MNTVVQQLTERYPVRGADDYFSAFREAVQRIVVQGLARNHFFERAAFYGGTALRIFYGLDRASEDMDFSLLRSDPDFRLASFGPAIETELRSFGIEAVLASKETARRSPIDSAFLKMNTRRELLEIGMPANLAEQYPLNSQVKIKLEVDTDPPPGFQTELKTQFAPTPHSVRIYRLPYLLAGKLHAVLYRGWKNRVKGRDWYDLVWYAGHAPCVNLAHLKERIRQSEGEPDTHSGESTEELTLAGLKEMLRSAVDRLDIPAAQKDVRPFLRHTESLDLWSKEFFYQVVDSLQADQDESSGGAARKAPLPNS